MDPGFLRGESDHTFKRDHICNFCRKIPMARRKRFSGRETCPWLFATTTPPPPPRLQYASVDQSRVFLLVCWLFRQVAVWVTLHTSGSVNYRPDLIWAITVSHRSLWMKSAAESFGELLSWWIAKMSLFKCQIPVWLLEVVRGKINEERSESIGEDNCNFRWALVSVVFTLKNVWISCWQLAVRGARC